MFLTNVRFGTPGRRDGWLMEHCVYTSNLGSRINTKAVHSLFSFLQLNNCFYQRVKDGPMGSSPKPPCKGSKGLYFPSSHVNFVIVDDPFFILKEGPLYAFHHLLKTTLPWHTDELRGTLKHPFTAKERTPTEPIQ